MVELKDTELNKKSKLLHQSTSGKEISAYFPKTSKRTTPLCFFQADDFKLLNGDFARSLKIPLGRDPIRELLQTRAIEEKKKKKQANWSAGFYNVRRGNKVAISLS